MFIMTLTNTMAMEPHIRARYNFAMSSFSRMYGVNRVLSSEDIGRFCIKWANEYDKTAPTGSLTDVDFYFRDFWNIWGGYL